MSFLKFKSIGSRIILPTIALTVLLLVLVGGTMVMKHRANARSMIDSKGLALANLLEKISIPYIDNYDYPSLEGFVQEAVKDPQVVFVVFYDGKNNPVTKSSQEPKEAQSVLLYERDIKGAGGKSIGRLRMGYDLKGLDDLLKDELITIGGSVLITIVLMILGLSLIVRTITKPLNRVIKGLSDNSDQVANSAGQVNAISHEQAEGASVQAAAIEETSSSLEQLSSMTRMNSENANETNRLVIQTSNIVDEVNTSVLDLTESMQKISQSSRQTQKIIKTIDEIAFQTNLLALNAAVEAARAGEAGAGFAVVADEVRNLAMRAAEAAKNTAALIEESVKQIADGSRFAAKTNENFKQVAHSSKQVAELMGEIATASTEQSHGIEELNKAVAEMDKVVQKNASNAQDSAMASEDMTNQAEEMRSYVRELLTLVGGNNDAVGARQQGGGQDAVGKSPTPNPARHSVQSPPAPRIKATVSPRKALPSRRQGPKQERSEEVRPEDVIPFDKEDFGDF